MAGERGLAKQIRTGLDEADFVNIDKLRTDPLDQLLERKPVRQHLKEFGVLFSLIFTAIAGYLIWKQRAPFTTIFLSILALTLTWCAYRAPNLLHPVWKQWMAFADFLGTIVTGIILIASWIILIIPVAIMLRIIRKKVMDCRYGAPVGSYWEERDPKKDDFQLLHNQF